MTGDSYRGYGIAPSLLRHGQLHFFNPVTFRGGVGTSEQDCRDQIDHQIADAMVQADVAAAGRARMADEA